MGCGGVGWGGWLASPVSGKGNKGPLCPVGVGPCCHGHGQDHWQEHVERGLKVGGGGKEWLGLARHVMARRRPGPFLTLQKYVQLLRLFSLNGPTLYTFALFTQRRTTGRHHQDTRRHHDTAPWHCTTPALTPILQMSILAAACFNARDGEGHTRSVLNAHPHPPTAQYAEVLNDWIPRSLVSAAFSQA